MLMMLYRGVAVGGALTSRHFWQPFRIKIRNTFSIDDTQKAECLRSDTTFGTC